VTTLLHDLTLSSHVRIRGFAKEDFESFPWTFDICNSYAVYSKVNLNCDVPAVKSRVADAELQVMKDVAREIPKARGPEQAVSR